MSEKIKARKDREAIALRINLKKRKQFQKKNKKKANNVSTFRQMDKKNV